MRTGLPSYEKYPNTIVECHNTYMKLTYPGTHNLTVLAADPSEFKNHQEVLILMDRELFYEVPEYVRDFVVYHHLSCYYNHDMNRGCCDWITSDDDINQKMIDADLYAYDMIGYTRILKAMNWIIDNYIEYFHGSVISRNEMIIRKGEIMQYHRDYDTSMM